MCKIQLTNRICFYTQHADGPLLPFPVALTNHIEGFKVRQLDSGHIVRTLTQSEAPCFVVLEELFDNPASPPVAG